MSTRIETFSGLFASAVRRRSHAVALRDAEGELSYVELDKWSNKAAHVATQLGVGRGERVALVLGNCREFLFFWFGLAKIGAVHVAINARLRGEALLYQATHCEPSCIVIDDEVLASLSTTERDRLPRVPTLVRGAQGNSALSLRAALEAASDSEPALVALRGSDPLVIMFTSGTTGAPKGVVVPHYAYVRAAEDLVAAMGLTESDCMYVCLPLYHGNPQVMAVSPTLSAGGSIALSPRFSASRFWDDIAMHQATAFTHIGSVVPILVKQPASSRDADNSLRVALGGAPHPAVQEFGRRFACEMLDGWGMIEAGCNTTVTPVTSARSLGQHGFARGCFEVRVVDEDDHFLEVGTPGEIVVRPTVPHVMFQGYFNAPDRTLDRLRNLWFHSGDRGRILADGSLEFLGRDEDAVRRAGENIPVELLEHELAKMDGVAEAVVVGIPDKIVGQELVACVVQAPGAGISAEAVALFLGERLGRSMQPRYVRVCDSLPRTASEKVQRFALRALGVEGAWDVAGREVEASDQSEL